MTTVAYAHPTISRSLESETEALRVAAIVMSASRVPRSATLWRSFRPALRDDDQSHCVPRPPDTDGAVGVDRRPPGLHDR
jgi:hypothetical protein